MITIKLNDSQYITLKTELNVLISDIKRQIAEEFETERLKKLIDRRVELELIRERINEQTR